MTVQTDIAMPKRQLKIVEDLVRQSAWATAIKDSVRAIAAEDKDCRVLDLAAGAGNYIYICSSLYRPPALASVRMTTGHAVEPRELEICMDLP